MKATMLIEQISKANSTVSDFFKTVEEARPAQDGGEKQWPMVTHPICMHAILNSACLDCPNASWSYSFQLQTVDYRDVLNNLYFQKKGMEDKIQKIVKTKNVEDSPENPHLREFYTKLFDIDGKIEETERTKFWGVGYNDINCQLICFCAHEHKTTYESDNPSFARLSCQEGTRAKEELEEAKAMEMPQAQAAEQQTRHSANNDARFRQQPQQQPKQNGNNAPARAMTP